jgi:hypothetical protein
MLPSNSGIAATPPLWGKLSPGPYAVGFRSCWELDYTRTYNTVFDDKTTYAPGKAPRPILINTWYPAQRTANLVPMRHRDYLAIETADARLAKFAVKLVDYERNVISRYVMGKPLAELTDSLRELFEEYLDTPTPSFRGATPADASFPLVIYHGGAGSSFEDNAVLCEFLASHGYYVVGSPFQMANGESFNIDPLGASAADIGFLIAHVRKLPDVDWNKIGVAGHSAGAQAILVARSLVASPIDAVVSLDTTQDYFGIAASGWDYLTEPLLKNSKNMSVPLLMVANAHANFELIDRLKHAERYYLTVSDLGHDEFVAQGIARRIVECNASPDSADLRAALDAASAAFNAICEVTLAFFDAHLKNRMSDLADLMSRYGANKLGGPAPHLDHAAAGVLGPAQFRNELGAAPTPRQFRQMLAARGVESTIELLKQHHEHDPSSPIFREQFIWTVAQELIDQKRNNDAIAFARLAKLIGHDIAKSYADEGDLMRRYDAMEEAEQNYAKALILDPTNAQAIAGLKALRDAEQASAKK